MPSFPPPGAVTVCEINRDLVAADSLSDDRAKEAYGDVLGMVFSPIPFQPDALPPIREPPAAEQTESNENVPAASVTSSISEFFKRMIFPPQEPNLLQKFDTQKISWNPHKHCLAFVSGKNQVTVHDFEDSDAKEPCILTSDHVKAIEWRPNSGKMIAVACKGGICLWSASYPGNAPFMKAGVTSSSLSAFRSGDQWILVDVLRDSSAEQVSALCWKPDGRYLASASCNSPSFTIWDVSQGLGTPIRRGLSNISLLRWSPSGDYLLAAKFDGTFHFWETNTWTSEPWSSSNGYVSGANWDPEGHVALLSFSNSTTLGSIHFSSKPPSLDAHLLPVELPEISSLIVSRGIEKLAWDASGERLALSFKDGNEMYRGLVAVYDVRRSPLVSLSLVGFIRGPGEGAKPLAFAFHNKFKQGPLLSVCWSSGWCCTYPLILHSH
ncbi:hypothetical protein SEVIR_7G320800v4 [Setaria viridis]|uniref:Aladin seven-bladed propeller domain-containing protein n=1 Tax=Setaria viridis TaxID=4556 RepID=A0A4U6TZ11_SETVI|nr:aladin-like [Setaria viridis]TKW07652.1 hypothetical protein SEVIR_7G320800v2 [Setaria viridis]